MLDNNSGLIIIKNTSGTNKTNIEYTTTTYDPTRYYGNTETNENTRGITENTNLATYTSNLLREENNKKGNSK